MNKDIKLKSFCYIQMNRISTEELKSKYKIKLDDFIEYYLDLINRRELHVIRCKNIKCKNELIESLTHQQEDKSKNSKGKQKKQQGLLSTPKQKKKFSKKKSEKKKEAQNNVDKENSSTKKKNCRRKKLHNYTKPFKKPLRKPNYKPNCSTTYSSGKNKSKNAQIPSSTFIPSTPHTSSSSSSKHGCKVHLSPSSSSIVSDSSIVSESESQTISNKTPIKIDLNIDDESKKNNKHKCANKKQKSIKDYLKKSFKEKINKLNDDESDLKSTPSTSTCASPPCKRQLSDDCVDGVVSNINGIVRYCDHDECQLDELCMMYLQLMNSGQDEFECHLNDKVKQGWEKIKQIEKQIQEDGNSDDDDDDDIDDIADDVLPPYEDIQMQSLLEDVICDLNHPIDTEMQDLINNAQI